MCDNCKVCAAKDSEIAFLRSRVVDLEEQVMSFVSQAHSQWQSTKHLDTPMPLTYVGQFGVIESMEAVTEQDKQDKASAMDQINAIMAQ
jgi:hypothetical protein